jgi:hypothetical protein
VKEAIRDTLVTRAGRMVLRNPTLDVVEGFAKVLRVKALDLLQ